MPPCLRLAAALTLFVGMLLGVAPSPSFSAPAGQAPAPAPAPPARDLAELAQEVASLHGANGGATVNLYRGDLSGQPLYVVVVYPELSVAVAGRELAPDQIRDFAAVNLALLRDPRNNVGTWYDAAGDRSWLDVSTAVPDREQALAWARQYNQASVFDLLQLESIETGGSGEPPANLPPIEQRLPAASPAR